AEHPEGLLVALVRSKTDQEQAGRRVEIVYGNSADTCPVRAWRRWLEESGIRDGPAYRPIDRHGNVSANRLSAQAVGIVVKRHTARLGHDTRDFAGHSLRRGMATTAARNGAAERTIMRATGHTATETLRGYIEEGEQFSDPASGYLDL
ncbi:MAG TPA: integrase, partial [Acidimicrobiaceae bacterium]|nr:integrase [Acidimicrobiaceae bacterium]